MYPLFSEINRPSSYQLAIRGQLHLISTFFRETELRRTILLARLYQFFTRLILRFVSQKCTMGYCVTSKLGHQRSLQKFFARAAGNTDCRLHHSLQHEKGETLNHCLSVSTQSYAPLKLTEER